MNKAKIEIKEFNEAGYSGVVTYESWKVAMLNYIDELETDQIDNFQAHLKTDESFILLKGHCILYLCDVVDNKVKNIKAYNMEPFKVYNIKQGVYHTHTLNQAGKVLIVENEDTKDDNSPKIMIKDDVRDILTRLKQQFWDYRK
ncbi:MAG: hypothetical protein K9L74_03300 [Candidatus Izimaplasma sp.]|nr:hypothetical protein [Candidatus Izimaplasma bacterium]